MASDLELGNAEQVTRSPSGRIAMVGHASVGEGLA